jgi:hypothetical protein
VPTQAEHRYDLDVRSYAVTIPDGGVSTPPLVDGKDCKQPQLRLRLAQVTVNTESEKLFFSNIYCMVRADDGVNAEVVLTPKTTVLHDGQTFYLDPGEGIFWGQKGLVATQSNLTLTYNCWKVGSDGLAAALDAIAKAAAAAGSVAGPWGWAFGIGSVAAAAAAAAAAADSKDKHLLNAQQTLDHATLLDLTNGRTWDIQQDGHGAAPAAGYWDWTLTIQSWGCADAQPLPPQ